MVVKHHTGAFSIDKSLRVVLSHMVVKLQERWNEQRTGLRVVLSHMVVKLLLLEKAGEISLRVVLSHMVVKLNTLPFNDILV